MDEDAPSLTLALIINLMIYIVIPLVMAYRRGHFINAGGKLRYYWDIIAKNTANYPKDWTITKIRPLSKSMFTFNFMKSLDVFQACPEISFSRYGTP